jgi:hypothetical protein
VQRAEVRRRLPDALIEPPIARGDLGRLRRTGVTRFVVIDGAFAHQFAVAPSEIVAAAQAGAQLVGAASIGAIRAAECWPAGMQGVGAVYALYRLGVIRDDDEVAVATEPERSFAPASDALINVRFMVLAALRAKLLSKPAAADVLTTAKRTHFSQRRWLAILRSAGVRQSASLARIGESTDVKRRDACRALEHVAALGPPPAPRAVAAGERDVSDPVRYRGHDRDFGFSDELLRRELARWLIGSGRYRRHLGADAVSGEHGIDPSELWSRLERSGELDSELMRWYAIKRACAVDTTDPGEGVALQEAQRYVASLHGYQSWGELLGRIRAERLGSIPMALIGEASRSLAVARRNAQK